MTSAAQIAIHSDKNRYELIGSQATLVRSEARDSFEGFDHFDVEMTVDKRRNSSRSKKVPRLYNSRPPLGQYLVRGNRGPTAI